MCGIAGGWFPEGAPPERLDALARRMAQALHHRGPDDAGVHVDARSGVFLAHARLAVVDLTATGHQPMRSASGRYAIVFNGEIYNHAALRAALPAQPWRGHSDTETLLAGIEHWGLEGALERAVGMFALALWDTQDEALWLARDRAGEKPLYWGHADGRLFFASELKAIVAALGRRPPVDRSALVEFLRHGYVPAPRSIHEGIRKLPPGAFVRLDRDAVRAGAAAVRHYWDPIARLTAARAAARPWDEAAYADAVERALAESIREQMVADVPVGAFLSGGVDSSLVVALMQQAARVPVRTFTIGFDVPAMDEAPHAKAVSRHLGTAHTELYVTESEARAVVPALASIYDEPFADSSQIPTLLVSSMARRHVTVCLSGDGGDELFGGYSRYASVRASWLRQQRLAPAVRRTARATLARAPRPMLDAMGHAAGWLRGRPLARPLGAIAVDRQRRLDCATLPCFYRQTVSHWPDPAALVTGRPAAAETAWPAVQQAAAALSPAETLMLADTLTYLPDDILVKVDRASMAHSLELRAPLLDWRLMELAWQAPPALREGKRVLKTLLDRHVPRAITERPKMGFGVPLAEWLRGPLRPWAEDLLSEDAIRRAGYLEPRPVRERWRQHVAGTADWSYSLWIVLMFNAWLAAGDAHA